MERQQTGREGEAPGVVRFLVRPWILTVACLVVLAVVVGVLLGWHRGGDPAALLRAIDAAHAVPEEENAARIYTKLVEDVNLPSLNSSLLPHELSETTLALPWRDAEFPQVAAWIKERQKIVDLLLEAGRKPQCWFSVSEPLVQRGRRTPAVRQWHELLVRAAYNDLGEGRVDAGLEKMLCMLRQTRHFYSQSNPADYFIGVSMASFGLRRFRRLVVMEDVSSEWLARFEAALPPVEGPSAEQLQRVQEVSRLQFQEMQRGVLARLLGPFLSGRPRRNDDFDTMYKARCRVARILIALRRHRNRTGRWPADLKEVQSEIPPVALSDPLSGKSFVYRPQGHVFVLYSIGTDGADDGGKSPGDRPF
jgi:hypothetical protein